MLHGQGQQDLPVRQRRVEWEQDDVGIVGGQREQRHDCCSQARTGHGLLRDPIERVAQPLLRRLVAEAPVPVVAHLGVLQGHETVYLLKEQSDRLVTTVTEVGVRLPAAITASGRAVLTELPRAQVRAQMSARGACVDRTGRGPQSLSTLTRVLGDERRQGYAEEDGFITHGYASVAAVVRDREGNARAAVGITFRSEGVGIAGRRQLASAARRCAADVTRRL